MLLSWEISEPPGRGPLSSRSSRVKSRDEALTVSANNRALKAVKIEVRQSTSTGAFVTSGGQSSPGGHCRSTKFWEGATLFAKWLEQPNFYTTVCPLALMYGGTRDDKESGLIFKCSSDAAFADGITTRKSTEGYLFKLFVGATYWKHDLLSQIPAPSLRSRRHQPTSLLPRIDALTFIVTRDGYYCGVLLTLKDVLLQKSLVQVCLLSSFVVGSGQLIAVIVMERSSTAEDEVGQKVSHFSE